VVSGGAGGTGLNMPLYAAGMLFEQHMRRRRGMIPRHHRRKSLHLTLGIRRSCVYDLAGSERRAKFHPVARATTKGEAASTCAGIGP
jgi:hypothetical protein